jgi:hypothetical protein
MIGALRLLADDRILVSKMGAYTRAAHLCMGRWAGVGTGLR